MKIQLKGFFMNNNNVSWTDFLQFCLVIIGVITICIMYR